MIPKVHSTQSVVPEDQLEKLLKPTGCLELHYKVQECIFETKDWRKCQTDVHNFQKCMEAYKAKEELRYSNTKQKTPA